MVKASVVGNSINLLEIGGCCNISRDDVGCMKLTAKLISKREYPNHIILIYTGEGP